MECNNCEYYYESKVSILLAHQKVGEDTDLGVRLIVCKKMEEILKNTNEYAKHNSKKTSSICTIKKFDVEDDYKNLIPITCENEKIIAPDWCPKKNKK